MKSQNHNELRYSITSHLSEWLSWERPPITTIIEDVQKRKPQYTVDGKANWCSENGEQYGNPSKKTKKRTTIWYSSSTPVYISIENENTNSKDTCNPMSTALFTIPRIKDMEQQTVSKWGKEYIKAVYHHPAYLTYMQSTSWEMLGSMNHKLVSIAGSNINNLRYADYTSTMAESE